MTKVKGTGGIALGMAIGVAGALAYGYYILTCVDCITIKHDPRVSPAGQDFFLQHVKNSCTLPTRLPLSLNHPSWQTATHTIRGLSRVLLSYQLELPCLWINQDILLTNGTRIPSYTLRESLSQELPLLCIDHEPDPQELSQISHTAKLLQELKFHLNINHYTAVWHNPYQIMITDHDTGSTFICQARTRLNPAQYHELTRLMRFIKQGTYDVRCDHFWTITEPYNTHKKYSIKGKGSCV
jgi:hypothetical protein